MIATNRPKYDPPVVTDERTSIEATFSLLAYNYWEHNDALKLLDELRSIEDPTLDKLDAVLLSSDSKHAAAFRKQFRSSYDYYFARWHPDGTIFEVITTSELELRSVKKTKETSLLPPGTYRMTVKEVSVMGEENAGTKYPWLVTEDGLGCHLGWFHNHTWDDRTVTLHRVN